jgi:hypothetical protein
MTLQIAEVTIADLTLLGALDNKGNYYVSVPELERALDLRANSTREICASKGLKAAVGLDISLGKKRVGSSTKTFLPCAFFQHLIGYIAYKQGNVKAQALLMACFTEAFERRLDYKLGVHKTEETRYDLLAENFREICRKEFQPEFTEWLKYDENTDGKPANYALCVNQLKKAAKLPLDTVDVYDQEQLRTWSKAITSYGNYRELGMNHKLALQKVTLKFDKP